MRKESRTSTFLPSITNKKHLLCILLMLEGGLKVKEVIQLKWADYNLKKKLLHIRGIIPGKDRTIHLVQHRHLHKTLEDYAKNIQKKGEFLLAGRRGPLTRQAIEKIRNNVKKKYPTTKNPLQKIIHSISIENQLKKQNKDNNTFTTISREAELEQINTLLRKNCNILLLGPIGIGKSHLIKQIMHASKQKTLFIDDFSEVKKTLIEFLIYLYNNEKKEVKELLYGDYNLQKLHQNLQRTSIENLTQEIIKKTSKKEYLIVINHVDNITHKAIKTIEKLKDHFTIITSARQIHTDKISFAWDFQIIHIKKLNKESSIALIKALSESIPIEDETTYINHIYRQSDGNPRIITELISRFQKEGNIITEQTIRETTHIGNRKEYDLSIIIIVILAGLAALRYVANEIEEPRLRIIGSIALLILIIYRYFFSKIRKNKHYK